MRVVNYIKNHILITVYFLMSVCVFFIAAYGYYFKFTGEYGLSGHLFLLFTGAPFSLVSWFLPHGSLKAIFVSGLMGAFQWFLFGKFIEFMERRRKAS